MATGTVTYKSDMMFPHREIYNGASAQTWPMKKKSGDFPKTKYTVTSAVIKFDVRNAFSSDRHMIVSAGGVQLGDVPTGTTGMRTENLDTNVSYENITSIKTDGIDRWACQLRGGSFIEIVVTWEETEPEENTEGEKKKKTEPVITGTVEKGETGYAMTTKVSVAFEGVDITDDITPYLLTMSYTDNEEDEADDLQLKLQDREGTWLKKWLNTAVQKAAFGGDPMDKGMNISAGIVKESQDGKQIKASCGQFELDSIKASGPPSTITIKGTSLPYGNGCRTEERDKSWEKYKLSGIGKEIAGNAGLGFMFDSPDDPSFDRVEQAKQTDIAFLQQLCHENGLSLKVSGMKLIIFDQAKYESLKPYTTVKWMDGSYTKYDLTTQDGDTHYDECVVSYYDPKQKKLIKGSAISDEYKQKLEDAAKQAKEDKKSSTKIEKTVCKVTNRPVSDEKEAEKLAKKILRLHNKFEKKVTLTMIGNPMLGAGITIALSGFGLWDEKYIIKQAKHEIGNSGYTTKITLRSIPEGKVTTESTEEEEENETSGGGNGNGQGNGGNRTQYEYRTNCGVEKYPSSDATKGNGFIAKDVKISILSAVKNGRRLVSCATGGQSGWISSSAISSVPVKK